MSEKTLLRTMVLPAGQDWVWYPDLNMVGLSDRLDEQGRREAVRAMQWWWQRAGWESVDPPNEFVVSGNVAV